MGRIKRQAFIVKIARVHSSLEKSVRQTNVIVLLKPHLIPEALVISNKLFTKKDKDVEL